MRYNIRKTPSGKLVGPLVEFRKIFRECIESLCRSSGCIKEIDNKKDEVATILKEYKEYEGIILDIDEIIRSSIRIIEED